MTQNIDLEIKVIKNFIDKFKQDRYIQFILSPKNRQKFIADLSHFNFLQWDKFDKVNGNEREIIMTTLQKRKVLDTTCYVISENEKIDTKILDIKTAISETVGYGMGTILVFGNADIIFYESETMNNRYISKDN
jgi:hypothetical protein